MKDKSLLPLLAAVLSNVLWGSTFLFSKILVPELGPVNTALYRFFFAIIAFLVAAYLFKVRLRAAVVRHHFFPFLSLGIVGFSILFASQMWGLKYISSSESSVLMLMAPVFTVAIESIRQKKAVVMEFLMIFTAFVGAGLIILDQYKVNFGDVNLSGVWFTLLAAFCLGASVIQTRALQRSELSLRPTVAEITFFSILIGFLFLLPLADFSRDNIATLFSRPELMLGVLYLSVVCSVIAFFLWNWSVKHMSTQSASVTMYIKTPVAIGIGTMIAKEQLSYRFFLGTVLIMGAVVVGQTLNNRNSSK